MPTIKKTCIGMKREADDTGRANARSVYNTATWKKLRHARLVEYPVCERCGKNLSEHVHHLVPIPRYADPMTIQSIGFNPDNLCALCRECHDAIHHNKPENESGT